MKKILFIIIIIIASFANNAQAQKLKPASANKYFDSGFIKRQYKNVLLIPQSLTYTGNNYHFDIYKSTPDNMTVVKPDSTIIFTMPVAGNIQVTQAPVQKINR